MSTAIQQVTTTEFELKQGAWHIRVSSAADGTAIIERVSCPARYRPATWTSPRTAEEWVSIQRKPEQYASISK